MNDHESGPYRKLTTDVMLTYGILHFSRHLIEGKTDPKQFFDSWNYRRLNFENQMAEEIFFAIMRDKLELFIEEIIPESNYYTALYHWMVRYYRGEFDGTSYLELDHLPLKFGYTGPEIIDLKYRLSQFGSYSTRNPSPDFDLDLENAVRSFQKKMGIISDGIIGRETLAALNITPEQKRDIIRVNMERARWLLHVLPDEFLMVNIAGYELYYFRNEEVLFQTPVIVGEADHQTPVFFADLKTIEFNCTWTVPRSIAVNEILPTIKKKPQYLETNHFEVLQGGRVTDPSSISWDEFSSDYFPVTLRQLPGPYNPLGKIKFIFPNDYMVYLHDTPAKNLFEEEGSRAFSHGCVRVKNPLQLATMILGKQGMTSEEIDSILQTSETVQVEIEQPIPVFLTYWTVFPSYPVDADAGLHWVRDIYGRDEEILRALNR